MISPIRMVLSTAVVSTTTNDHMVHGTAHVGVFCEYIQMYECSCEPCLAYQHRAYHLYHRCEHEAARGRGVLRLSVHYRVTCALT